MVALKKVAAFKSSKGVLELAADINKWAIKNNADIIDVKYQVSVNTNRSFDCEEYTALVVYSKLGD
jgi:hypothetical protein